MCVPQNLKCQTFQKLKVFSMTTFYHKPIRLKLYLIQQRRVLNVIDFVNISMRIITKKQQQQYRLIVQIENVKIVN
jgi:hypothetical protein